MLCTLYALRLLSIAEKVDEQFFMSCRSGDTDTVHTYLESGTPVSSRDSKGNNAIIIASGRGKTEVIKLLIKYGANVEDYTLTGLFEGKSALCWASSQGRTEAVALLIQEGANPHKPSEIGVFKGKTALLWASSQGRTEVVKLLISAGVDIDYSSNTGNFVVS